jgi:hypothetical protein
MVKGGCNFKFLKCVFRNCIFDGGDGGLPKIKITPIIS